MKKIKNFTIADVAYLHDIKPISESFGETFCECPFCGDARGKFSYIVKKDDKANMFHCWECGKGGSSVDLHIMLSEVNYADMKDPKKQAIKDIFRAIESDTKFVNFHEEHFREEMEQENVERASDEYCSRVYLAMLKRLPLLNKHKADLIKRGLTEKDIKRFWFRSTPQKNTTEALCASLIEQGFSLKGVPGFFINEKGHWDFKCAAGYFCPAWDGEFNQLVGFQVRADNPIKGAKYVWVSSSGKLEGVSSGSPISYLPGEHTNAVVIVEGILKSIVVYCLLEKKVTVIGVPGINATKGLDSYLERFNPDNTFIFEAYDMDKAIVTDIVKDAEKTKRIATSEEKLRDKILYYGFIDHVLKWDYDENGDWKGNWKGLDDYILVYDNKMAMANYFIRKATQCLKLKNLFSSKTGLA